MDRFKGCKSLLDPEEQLFHKRGQKGSKVIEPAADTLRILADCRPFLKRLLPFEKEKEKEEEREWFVGKFLARKPREGLRETLRVSSGLGEPRCSALSKVDRLGITVKREPAGWLKEHD